MTHKTIIESLGVYLPPEALATSDVINGCRRRIRFPLERMTGIKSRRVARKEYSIDLARKAIERCLATSRFGPQDVEVLISTSVGRSDGPSLWLSHEPSMAVRLKAQCGLGNAVTFDLASACSGMFAAINVVDALLATGRIRRALVVSGEYISHLAETAQKEIDRMLDPRMACLTLGDAGAAVLLTTTSNPDVGFDAIDLCTVSSCAEYCIAAPTEEDHGGGIMHTDALKMTEAATRYGSAHALQIMERAGWSASDFQHLIMHQTSRTGLTSAMREINRMMSQPVCHRGNTIDNLAERGNTASTTHFVALADSIRDRRIRAGDKTIFAVSGSGLTVGTALYTFDDLPERLAAGWAGAEQADPGVEPNGRPASQAATVCIRGAGLTPRDGAVGHDTMDLLRSAASACLDEGRCRVEDVDLLIHAGMYRTGFTVEPAIAALLAGQMGMDSTFGPGGRKFLAFDVLNGSLGLLNACAVAVDMIRSGKSTRALLVTAEVENNAHYFPDELLGLEEVGSALLCEEASEPGRGFGAFLFRDFTEHAGMFYSRCTNRDGKPYLLFERDPALWRMYLECITEVLDAFLDRTSLDLRDVSHVFAPQISPQFLKELTAALGVDQDVVVDIAVPGRDLFTSSFPYALQHARDRKAITDGDLGLILAVGSGIQVGCASYRF